MIGSADAGRGARRFARLTRSGRRLAWLGVAGQAGGRVVGLPEISVLGLIAVALVAVAWLVTSGRGLQVAVARRIRPRRVTVGQTVSLRLEVRPTRRRPTPTLAIIDTIDGTALAPQHLAPVPSGSSRSVPMDVVAAQRGIARIGPVVVRARDPFGLAELDRRIPVRDEVIVWPAIDDLSATEATPGVESETVPLTATWTAPSVEDAPRLREFQPGDDVRRVHWPSTARLGTPIVREVDQPAEHRTVVVLDARRANHDGPSFERAVSAAASVVADRVARDEPVRLITSSGAGGDDIVDRRRLDALFDELAALAPQGGGNLRGVLRTLAGPSGDGLLVLCTGRELTAEELTALTHAAPRDSAVIVSCGDRAVADGGVQQVRFGAEDRLGERWRAAFRRSSDDGAVSATRAARQAAAR